jgi:hypothetical protein
MWMGGMSPQLSWARTRTPGPWWPTAQVGSLPTARIGCLTFSVQLHVFPPARLTASCSWHALLPLLPCRCEHGAQYDHWCHAAVSDHVTSGRHSVSGTPTWGARTVAPSQWRHPSSRPQGLGLPHELHNHAKMYVTAVVYRPGRTAPASRRARVPRDSGGVVSFSCCDGLVYLLGYTGSV